MTILSSFNSTHTDLIAEPNPSCLQATIALGVCSFHSSYTPVHTVPQVPLYRTSSRPACGTEDPVKRVGYAEEMQHAVLKVDRFSYFVKQLFHKVGGRKTLISHYMISAKLHVRLDHDLRWLTILSFRYNLID